MNRQGRMISVRNPNPLVKNPIPLDNKFPSPVYQITLPIRLSRVTYWLSTAPLASPLVSRTVWPPPSCSTETTRWVMIQPWVSPSSERKHTMSPRCISSTGQSSASSRAPVMMVGSILPVTTRNKLLPNRLT